MQPKYIAVLKKTADRRKIEQDIIYERKVQREMEVDNDQFGDKDAFVTSGYKKKLAERKILEAELEKEAATEGKCVIMVCLVWQIARFFLQCSC